MHAPFALVLFIVPKLITYGNCPFEIQLGNCLTRGMTVCDFLNLTSAKLESITARATANRQVAVSVSPRALFGHIMDAFLELPATHHTKKHVATAADIRE